MEKIMFSDNHLKYFILGSLILFVVAVAQPCTTFVLNQGDKLVFGRNLDWVCGNGLLMTNQRHLQKTALVDTAENPATWVAKYGSVTFNQVGKELPYGGINEAGLVVEHATLDQTVYPAHDGRPAIGALQWIQYQLDNYATVQEVIQSDSLVRIYDPQSHYHYMVCDRSGDAAVIEFLDGKRVVHHGADCPVKAMANSTYNESMRFYDDREKQPGDPSLQHFATAAEMTCRFQSAVGDSAVANAFSILNVVSQGLFTKWSIVYDITDLKIYFKVYETPTIAGEQKIFTRTPGEAKLKVVDINSLDFSCAHAGKALDLDYDGEGVMNANMVDFTTALNHSFIVKAFTFFTGWGIPMSVSDTDMQNLAAYPESFGCEK